MAVVGRDSTGGASSVPIDVERRVIDEEKRKVADKEKEVKDKKEKEKSLFSLPSLPSALPAVPTWSAVSSSVSTSIWEAWQWAKHKYEGEDEARSHPHAFGTEPSTAEAATTTVADSPTRETDQLEGTKKAQSTTDEPSTDVDMRRNDASFTQDGVEQPTSRAQQLWAWITRGRK